jgi:multidrug efflux pump subunit AcrA (membrane-fusion protein)
VPRTAIVERGEVTAVYVVDDKGMAQLRQVRLGRRHEDRTEVLAGIEAGERIALDTAIAAGTHE